MVGSPGEPSRKPQPMQLETHKAQCARIYQPSSHIFKGSDGWSQATTPGAVITTQGDRGHCVSTRQPMCATSRPCWSEHGPITANPKQWLRRTRLLRSANNLEAGSTEAWMS